MDNILNKLAEDTITTTLREADGGILTDVGGSAGGYSRNADIFQDFNITKVITNIGNILKGDA